MMLGQIVPPEVLAGPISGLAVAAAKLAGVRRTVACYTGDHMRRLRMPVLRRAIIDEIK
jgi:hypothetical protein